MSDVLEEVDWEDRPGYVGYPTTSVYVQMERFYH